MTHQSQSNVNIIAVFARTSQLSTSTHTQCMRIVDPNSHLPVSHICYFQKMEKRQFYLHPHAEAHSTHTHMRADKPFRRRMQITVAYSLFHSILDATAAGTFAAFIGWKYYVYSTGNLLSFMSRRETECQRERESFSLARFIITFQIHDKKVANV